jgi:hypothetical protein
MDSGDCSFADSLGKRTRREELPPRGNDKGNSRSPSGMTTRKAKTTAAVTQDDNFYITHYLNSSLCRYDLVTIAVIAVIALVVMIVVISLGWSEGDAAEDLGEAGLADDGELLGGGLGGVGVG